MKKLFYAILVFFITMFMFNNYVYAEDCNNLACATCTYGKTVKYTLSSNGDGTITVSAAPVGSYSKVIDKTSAVNFMSPENNKIACPNELFAKSGANRNGSVHEIYNESDKSTYKITLSEQTNNDKPLVKDSSNNQTSPFVKSCEYTKAKNALKKEGTVDIKTTINLMNDGTLNVSCSNGYTAKVDSKLDPQIFNSDTCPTIAISCGDSGASKYCYISQDTKYNGSQSGSDTKTSDDINGNNDKDDTSNSFKYKTTLVCGFIGKGTFNYIKLAWNILKYSAPALVVILGMLDFAKVVLSGEDKDMKVAGHKFLKRIIAAVVLILLPILIQFIFSIANFSEDCLQYFK